MSSRITEEVLAHFFYSSAEEGKAIACWRLPDEDNTQAISSHNFEKAAGQPQRGFCFMPFDKKETGYFIPSDFFVGNARNKLERKIPEKYFGNLINGHSFSEPEYTSSIRIAQELIKQDELSKVVLSRNIFVPLSSTFDLIKFYFTLCVAYPQAFVFLVALPEIGVWIGASPELLLQAKGDKMDTVSLAGTLRPDGNPNWSDKEKQEQSIISDYISQKLKDENIINYKKGETETISAGELKHLATSFSFSTNKLWWPVANSLHPTPAVCGYPTEKAYQLIQKLEPHHRSFYSGFSGPCNMNDSTNMFVNIRLMRLHFQKAELFAGAGITLQSDPTSEWKETEAKLHAIRQYI